jgi:hypothetical protein
MTRWLALLLRFVAVWFAWKAYRAIFDLFAAMQILHRPSGLMSPSTSEAFARLSKEYPQNVEGISSEIYHQIGFSIFFHLFFAIVLWRGCRVIAGVFTDGLDPAEPPMRRIG